MPFGWAKPAGSKWMFTKAELRSKMRNLLKDIPSYCPSSKEIGLSLKQRVALFKSLPGEPDTTRIAQEAGLLLYPETNPLLYAQRILEAHVSVIYVPGLAFDKAGNRLGRGGGYYDRCIELLRRSPHCPAIFGLCFKKQLLPRVPTEAHDQKVDRVIVADE